MNIFSTQLLKKVDQKVLKFFTKFNFKKVINFVILFLKVSLEHKPVIQSWNILST